MDGRPGMPGSKVCDEIERNPLQINEWLRIVCLTKKAADNVLLRIGIKLL